MRLSDLKNGETASIVKVTGHGGFRKRIIEMGFVKGKMVESLQDAPLNDPVKYRVMGYEVSLRRSEAAMVEVITEEQAKQMLQPENGVKTFVGEEDFRRLALKKRKEIVVALVGNPNCGKTTLFNIASGSREKVGNYGGVTVDSKEGTFAQDGYTFRIVDLPGTYSISAYTPEEKYVRQFLSENAPDVIINVVDATNLERNLYLTTQLIDMHQHTILALNMFDEFKKNGDKLNYKKLGDMLGMPITPIIAKTGFGIIQLFRSVIKIYESSNIIDEKGILHQSLRDDPLVDEYLHDAKIEHKHAEKQTPADFIKEKTELGESISRHVHIDYGHVLEPSVERLYNLLYEKNRHLQSRYSIRYLSLKLLEADEELYALISDEANADEIMQARNEEVARIESLIKVDIETAISDAKYGFVAGALKETLEANKLKLTNTITSRLDKILIGKYTGYPVFILFMYIMFQATFTLGEYPMGWIEDGVAWLGTFLGEKMSAGPLKDLLIEGVLAGVGGVIVFLPNILILYLFISLMEDTGYMARAAFIMDKLMNRIGLHGKSFIPLIMGFGCNVPAIMATRTIEDRNSRFITILINPLMSCSARLPVYLLLAGMFFPRHAGLVLFGMYATGIVLAILIALIFKNTLFKKKFVPFVMELPPYRFPTGKAIWSHTWSKGSQYLRKMGTIILVGSIIIWFLGYYPRPAESELQTAEQRTEQLENSYLGKVGKIIEPTIKPLGFDWKVGIALLSGVAAKEIVVSTLGVIYTGESEEEVTTLSQKMKVATWPDGEPVFTPAVALALMIFVLIYFPCVATFVAIKNETGAWKWALFSLTYSMILAWGMAWFVFKIFSL